MSIYEPGMEALLNAVVNGLIVGVVVLYYKKKIMKEQEKYRELHVELEKSYAAISELRRIVKMEREK